MLGAILDHAQALATGDDAWRLAQRRAIRKQMAERDQTAARVKILSERVGELNREKDSAADVHHEVTAPVQAELSQLDEQVIELTADRKPIPSTIEDRRRELLQIIETSNEQLSDTVERLKRISAPIEKQVEELTMKVAMAGPLETKLTHPDVANPNLLLAHFIARQANDWAVARMKAAEKHIRDNESLARAAKLRGDKVQEADYLARNAKWEAEVSAASAVCQETNAAADATRCAMINE